MAELRDCVVVKPIECIGVTHINPAQNSHTAFRPWVTDIAELLDNLLASFCQLTLASCAEEYSGTCDRKKAPQLKADTQTASGDNRGTALV